MTSTVGYDIWSEDVTKTPNYPTSTNGGRHFKPQPNYPISTNGGRHFKPQASYQTPTYGGRHFEPPLNDSTSTYGGRHFKPQDTDLNEPTKITHIIRGETLQTPIFGDRQLDRSLE